ncbi:hypothetical protein PACTADRAFT_74584 [Pachysolen tannophilus NRRL Y-2460]|uniref:DNA repair and recombination protein RAD54 n=1 Tax=Pachysolen tannophilus NRRL Y-2460 TaxID=669874 RepID=A0A1E4TZ34_PACTA|nr:hypothetical protein PACTADRAFT_74584 [Pachysolen tannophilus NRRL Y-2460]
MGFHNSRRKLPDRPANEAGTGAGLPLAKRPRAVTDPTAILFQPFKIPINKRSSTHVIGAHGKNEDGLGIRKARLKGPQSYALMDVDVDLDNQNANGRFLKDDGIIDSEGNIIRHNKTKRSLFSRNYIEIVNKENIKFSQEFIVPVKVNNENSYSLKNANPPPVLGMKRKPILIPRPLYDPTSEYAIVLYDPTVDIIPEDLQRIKEEEEERKKFEAEEIEKAKLREKNSTIVINNRPAIRCNTHRSLNEILGISKDGTDLMEKKFPNVPVVIDPKLARILRPHQIAGVKFLYRCTAGLVDPRAKGCIMADEMGLGKTLQCLTLMWTLLRQGPRGKKTIDKAIVVCPSSLVKNWANEFDKWLGKGVLTPLAIDGKSVKPGELTSALKQWVSATGRNIVRPVLVISYETLRRNSDILDGTEIGLLLADEGHRLKNGDSLTFSSLNKLKCERRVILSGTPIQNDLTEYFSLLSFSNPGLLGSRAEFRKNFENAILKGRDFTATDEERQKSDTKLQELTQFVSKFIIRRTNDILSKYLPVKYEYVVFTKLSDMQAALYRYFITSPEIGKLLKGSGSQPLKAITLLKKLCNHPNLLNLPDDIEGCQDLIPNEYDYSSGNSGRNREVQTEFSGKFRILERFLHKIHNETDDKIVIISNYTQTLDIVEKLCRANKFGSFRLDGTMATNKRQKLVDKFNDKEGREFVFLLSSKAGGCGINLIGANRLVLVDPDWNPASDQQALARVWRDGQTKNCFIYRFISTGSIEEKIFQRQSAKLQLSSCVVDANEDVERLFSRDILRQLFQYQENTVSDTHDTFNCKRCNKETQKQEIKSKTMLYGDATTWNHIHPDNLIQNEDVLLKNESGFDDISYVFQYISH